MKPFSIPLTKMQKAIVLGSILGDGALEFGGYAGTRLQIKQSLQRKEYVFWLYERLKKTCNLPPKQRKDNKQWYFATRFTIELTWYYKKFYEQKTGRKKIPKDIADLLKLPLTLAVWYMDDGSLDYRPKDHCAFSFSVDNCSLDEAKLLTLALQKNFGINASIQMPSSRGKGYPKLYIGAKGREKFLQVVTPYIHRCFAYKLPQNRVSPSETESLPPWQGGDRRHLPSRKAKNSYHTPSSSFAHTSYGG